MNVSKPLRFGAKLLHSIFLKCRSYLPRQHCRVFGDPSNAHETDIGPIFVINLARQPSRWADMVRELDRILDASGRPLSERAVQFSACDAQSNLPEFPISAEVSHFYTLRDQLFVEPQPFALPDKFDLEQPIRMSRAEIAIAHSHIGVWKEIARSNVQYALVLEDDVWFHQSCGRMLEQAWAELKDLECSNHKFDILYVSYDEVRFGAPKEFISKNVFRPERGLWFLSGYILSKKGAQSLLKLLPTHGPIDLWINHKFQELKVRALRRSVINQRRDLQSTNSYSILPMLSRIGILDSGDASLFNRRPVHSPVFAFGDQGVGLSSLAMALSMLGYRCCSDFDNIPEQELENLMTGKANRVFDAYVNIGTLELKILAIIDLYPNGKFIFLSSTTTSFAQPSFNILDILKKVDVLHLNHERLPNWRHLCEHLKLAPPDAPYPTIRDIGLRKFQPEPTVEKISATAKHLRYDPSPWIAAPSLGWSGINTSMDSRTDILATLDIENSLEISFDEDFNQINPTRWFFRTDTFPGNLGLFRPSNASLSVPGELSLKVVKEPLGTREFSAAAITCRKNFLFGRFEVILKATSVPGLVTGFFLHRDSPRQEIDIEILGSQPNKLLVNVFYNPGTDGAKFDYGYRGTPTAIELGFDASQEFHRYTIEWDPCEIRWLVDQKLVHRRVIWAPTPIPHLPMALHINTWPSRSQEFAGRLVLKRLPSSAIVRRVVVDSNHVNLPLLGNSLISLEEQDSLLRTGK